MRVIGMNYQEQEYMPKFKFRAAATVSCWTEVEADTLEEAKEEAESRSLAGLVYQPFSGQVD